MAGKLNEVDERLKLSPSVKELTEKMVGDQLADVAYRLSLVIAEELPEHSKVRFWNRLYERMLESRVD